MIASLVCDKCSRSFDCLDGVHGLISHLEEGTCSKIFLAVEDYAAAKDSIERAAAVRSLNSCFRLSQAQIEEGWVLNEDPSQRVRLRRFFECGQNGDGSILGTAVAVLLHPLDGFSCLMLHDDGDMEELNRLEFDEAKNNFYNTKGWLNPLDISAMEHLTMKDGITLSQAAAEIREIHNIADKDLTVDMLLSWNKFIKGEAVLKRSRLRKGTTLWFRNPNKLEVNPHVLGTKPDKEDQRNN